VTLTVEAAGREITVSHPGKILFPESGVTKGELVEYYARVAEVMVPHVRGRPISMQQFPGGIGGQGFFRKDVPEHFRGEIRTVTIPKRGGTVTHAVADDAAALAYLANQNCVTPHVWLSRADRLDRPDRLIIDLDPSRADFAAVRAAARALGTLLRELGLEPFAMTTGSRGVHVTVPLQRRQVFEDVRAFAEDVAALMAARHPDELTTEFRKAKRGGRILLDVARNAWAQTAVPPYAVRPRPGAPVATPLRWRELSDARLRPDRHTVRTLFRRLHRDGDPWEEIAAHARPLGEARERLARRRRAG
jgi:bifunctional non-homologous end joining protein LigD